MALPHHEQQIARLQQLKQKLLEIKNDVEELERRKADLESQVEALEERKLILEKNIEERERQSREHDAVFGKETDEINEVIEQVHLKLNGIKGEAVT